MIIASCLPGKTTGTPAGIAKRKVGIAKRKAGIGDFTEYF